MAWALNGTPSTLTVSGDDIDITDLTAKKFNVFLQHCIALASNIGSGITFNNNSNTVYARRQSVNGAADATAVSQTSYSPVSGLSAVDFFNINYVCSISSEEKLIISFTVPFNTAGAGTAPNRYEVVGKFVPSPDADITRIDSTNQGSSDFDTSSNLSALGTN